MESDFSCKPAINSFGPIRVQNELMLGFLPFGKNKGASLPSKFVNEFLPSPSLTIDPPLDRSPICRSINEPQFKLGSSYILATDKVNDIQWPKENLERKRIEIDPETKVAGVRGPKDGIKGSVKTKTQKKGKWFRKKMTQTQKSAATLNKLVRSNDIYPYHYLTNVCDENDREYRNLVFSSKPIQSFIDDHQVIKMRSQGMRGVKPDPIQQIIVSRPKGMPKWSNEEAYQVTDWLVQSLELTGQPVACFAHFDEKKGENALHIVINRASEAFLNGDRDAPRCVISSPDLKMKSIILQNEAIRQGKSSEKVLPSLSKWRGIEKLSIQRIECPVELGIISVKDPHDDPKALFDYLEAG